jgi:hypothetical protein
LAPTTLYTTFSVVNLFLGSFASGGGLEGAGVADLGILHITLAYMDTLTVSLRHVASQRTQPCAVCAAMFVPAEDSGSRVLSIQAPGQEASGGLMCGGCYSKWSHGAAVTIRANAAKGDRHE